MFRTTVAPASLPLPRDSAGRAGYPRAAACWLTTSMSSALNWPAMFIPSVVSRIPGSV